MKYPKLPDGPNSPGAAAVRSLGEGTYQTKRSADYVAKTVGDFKRVAGQPGIQYVTSGDLGSGIKNYGASTYASGFHYTSETSGVACDYGVTAFTTSAVGYSQNTYAYPNTSGTGTDSFASPYAVTTSTFSVGKTTTSAKVQASVQSLWSNVTGGRLPIYRTGPSVNYWGRVNNGQGNEAKIISFYMTNNGRTDSAGRPLYDPTYSFIYSSTVTISYLLPTYGRASSDYETPAVAMSSAHIYVLLAERFTRTGSIPTGTDVRPGLWLYRSTDGGNGWTVADVRAALIGDIFQPTAGTGTYPYGIADWYGYNTSILYAMSFGVWAMCGNDVALYAFPYLDTNYHYASKIVAISPTGVSVVASFPSSTPAMVESMIYVGNNTIVAKKVAGIMGTGFAVTLMKSFDNGVTWTEFTPTGLAAPLLNQFFGNLYLDRADATPTDSTKTPRILMVGWDSTNLAYYVFVSLDYGATWVKKGRVGTPDTFRRIDTMMGGNDGGGYFNTLRPTRAALEARTVDLALPNRFVRTP